MKFLLSVALPLYALAFERAGALDKLEGFACRAGAAFYGLPPSTGTVTLVRVNDEIPSAFRFGDDEVIPAFSGESIPWRIP